MLLPDWQVIVNKLFWAFHEYEDAICWDTTCLNCSSLLDKNYEQYCTIDTQQAEISWLKKEVESLRVRII